jgi:serine/threonine-protein kinase HipA
MRARVSVDDVVVGEIERLGDSLGRCVFRFDQAYRLHPGRPVLGQLFEDRFPNDIDKDDGLSSWFEHILPPEKSPLRRALAREAGLDEDDGLGLLCWLGDELPGATRIRRIEQQSPYRRAPQPDPLPDLVSPQFRVALAGMQWKLSLNKDKTVLPLGGSGEWLAKFHSAVEHPGLAQAEFAAMEWARSVGLEVPAVSLVDCSAIQELPAQVPRGDGKAFLVERFDRTPNGRIHVEDFGQIFDRRPGRKSIAKAMKPLVHLFRQPALRAQLSMRDV